MYKLNLMGQHSVGIGSNTGDIDPLISNCFIGIKSVAQSAVGIGSFTVRCDMMIEHSSVNMDFEGANVVMLGSKQSEKLQISIYSATVIAQSKAPDITVVGSGTAAHSNVIIDYVSLRVDLGGIKAGIYRGMDDKVKVRVSNSKVEGVIFTSLDIPKHADDMDFQVTGSITKLDINGRLYELNSREA
jgi:hypothetical protein